MLSPSLYLSGFLLLTTLFLGYRYQSLDNELSVTKERLSASDKMNQKLKDEISEQDRLISLKLDALDISVSYVLDGLRKQGSSK